MLSMKRNEIIILAAIILLALFLRMYGIGETGLKLHDEGVYLLEANWMNGEAVIEYDYLNSLKPFHDMLIAGSMNIFGYYDWSGILVVAILGALTVGVVFFIGKELYGWKIGAISALSLALMGLHVAFSRTVLTEVTMTFFFALAILFYVLAKKNKNNIWFLALAGISTGISFEFRYFGILALAVFLIYELMEFKKKKTKETGKNLAIMFGAFFVIFLIGWGVYASYDVDYSYYLFGYARVFKPGRIVVDTFFPNVPVKDVHASGGYGVYGVSSLSEFGRTIISYSYFSIRTISIFILLFGLAGLYLALKDRKYSDKVVLSWFLFWFIFLIIMAHDRDRDLIMILPPLALLVGRGFDIFREKIFKKYRKYFEIGAIVLILITGLFGSIYAMNLNVSAYKNASDFLVENGVTGTVTSMTPVIGFYTHKQAKVLLPLEKERLQDLQSKGYNYVLVDELESIDINAEPVYQEEYETFYSYFYSLDGSIEYQIAKMIGIPENYLAIADKYTIKREICIYKIEDVIGNL